MLHSMTGYGRASGTTSWGEISVEIKTVNHRYFDPRVRLPRSLGALEIGLQNRLRARLSRGRIEVNLALAPQRPEQVTLRINPVMALRYRDLAAELATQLGLPGEVSLEFILGQPEVLTTNGGETPPDAVATEVFAVVDAALDELQAMRRREGQALAADMLAHTSLLQTQLTELERLKELAVPEFQARYTQRISQLLQDVQPDPARLAQEIALFADRCDVSEETARLTSHITQLHTALSASNGEPAGRKIEFLLQEVLREINTIGSKANNLALTQLILNMKTTVERIREQIQNVE